MGLLREGDEDATVRCILVEGVGTKGPTQIAYDLDNRFDRAAKCGGGHVLELLRLA
jgi:hypothetical protein